MLEPLTGIKWQIDMNGAYVRGSDGFPVAYVYNVAQGDEEAIRFARLITAAPDLYTYLVSFLGGSCGKSCAVRKERVKKLLEWVEGTEAKS